MPSAAVYDMSGNKVGVMELPESVFGLKPNKDAVYAAVVTHLGNRRQGTQSTKTRAEVSGGGRKPWRQKGTGRARQGSIRSPQWVHGGIALGPKPRDYTRSLNKKTRRLALLSALSAKAGEGGIIVIRGLSMDEIKTKTVASLLKNVSADKALMITKEPCENIIKSARNIPGVKTTFASLLSVYDIVNAKSIVVDEQAVSRIEEVYA